MNLKKIEEHWRQILIEIGENPDRPGLKDTPKRVAKMYQELFRGYDKTQLPKVTTFDNGEDGIVYEEMVTDTGSYYSQCEHHIVPFFGNYYFAYMPNKRGKILGLSKVARVVDYFSAKVQIQERLVQEIVDYLWDELCKDTKHEPYGMALVMRGEHLCKSMRGARKKGQMTTSHMRGYFRDNNATKEEFLKLIDLK